MLIPFTQLIIIRPIMDYCDNVWNCCGFGKRSSLERLQRRATKIVSKMSYSDRALDYLKWPSLVNRRESAMLMTSSRDALKDNARIFSKLFYFQRFCPQSNYEANEHVTPAKG